MDLNEHEFLWAEENHWWYKGKRILIKQEIARTMVNSKKALPFILDVGCSSGKMMEEIQETAIIEGIDSYTPSIERAKSKGLKVKEGYAYNIPYLSNTFNGVLLLDVLEHIEDDEKVLNEINRVLIDSGCLYLTVPAHPWLYSQHDHLLGHVRRYRYQELYNLLISCGFRIELLTYTNFFIFLPAVVVRILEKYVKKSKSRGSLPPILSNFLLKLYTFEANWLNFSTIPFGLSMYARARKERSV